MHGRLRHELPAFQQRLDRQARETRGLRLPLYRRAGLEKAARVLDVGCGTGAVTADLSAVCRGTVVAVDADASMARRSRRGLGRTVPVVLGDGARLPFADGVFDAAVCNLVLLWCRDPGALVQEMARVVRPGGTVLASMEPDYGAKVHWPENPLVDLVFQGEGVRRRGGDPHAGRKLRQHFTRAGLRTEVGIGNPDVPSPEEDLALLRRHRRHYRRMLHEAGFAAARIDAWEQECMEAVEAGVELCFLPFFYAVGRKPVPGDVDRP